MRSPMRHHHVRSAAHGPRKRFARSKLMTGKPHAKKGRLDSLERQPPSDLSAGQYWTGKGRRDVRQLNAIWRKSKKRTS